MAVSMRLLVLCKLSEQSGLATRSIVVYGDLSHMEAKLRKVL
jgi:hypothetical protein